MNKLLLLLFVFIKVSHSVADTTASPDDSSSTAITSADYDLVPTTSAITDATSALLLETTSNPLPDTTQISLATTDETPLNTTPENLSSSTIEIDEDQDPEDYFVTTAATLHSTTNDIPDFDDESRENTTNDLDKKPEGIIDWSFPYPPSDFTEYVRRGQAFARKYIGFKKMIKLREIVRRIRAKGGGPKAIHQAVEKYVNDILTPEQKHDLLKQQKELTKTFGFL
ncbi:unnamed protein product, partial [Mesorhabditis spiculigera]